MPHILVAGSTGSGKSVCINAIILSILMKASPDEVKFLMIDPKKVELSLYSDIPHLLAPVVTNPHKAAATLKQWALAEMERRYELFTEHGVKDLAGFNALAKASKEDDEIEPIPYIVVIIDEFADLMMVASQEVESTICRLAQMARATGIHLVIATQRPSVNVVTGLIKANVPSRVSFAVQSQIDSRTVLDMAGAEKLLGKGDMLYMPVGASKPDRVQGVFVSEKEVNGVVDFIKKQAPPDYDDEILDVEPITDSKKEDTATDSDKDDLFDQAKEIIQSTQYASTSYLQRKLRIGYNRAARLMDELEEAGVISAYDSDKKTRTVLQA
jgi:S-DNA-T family DNA segregation ATPase FtsK/SpoIIIE